MTRARLHLGMKTKNLDGLEPDIEAVRTSLRRQAFVAATFVKGLWIQRALDLKVSRTGAYIRGIAAEGQLRVISEHMGPDRMVLTFEIVNTAPHAKLVEDGHPAFSLVQAINWSSTTGRIKIGPKGPFLHIPFRHRAFVSPEERESSGTTRGTLKAMMPEHIHAEAMKLDFTRPRKEGPIRHGGRHVQADRYDYGGRMKHHATPSIQLGTGGQGAHNVGFEARRGERTVGFDRAGQPMTNPAWKGSKYHGMMRSSTRGHSSFTTIRTITPRSLGWNIPAMVGYGVARSVAASARSGVGARKLQAMMKKAALGPLRGGGQ